LPLAAGVFPAQRGDEFDVEVVDVSGSKGRDGGPGDGLLAAVLFGSGPALAVAAAATAALIFFFGGWQGIEAGVFADATEERGTARA
jgi:hypothetical protein